MKNESVIKQQRTFKKNIPVNENERERKKTYLWSKRRRRRLLGLVLGVGGGVVVVVVQVSGMVVVEAVGGRQRRPLQLEEKERACEHVRTWLILHVKLMSRVCRI
jgi:hypothetical protein